MPYVNIIAQQYLEACGWPKPSNAGELNYCFTILAKEYFLQHPNYQGINDIVGALEGAKAEFQRRIVAPYEDKKKEENGDVYTCIEGS